jgi:hypothetical protein
VLVAILAVAIVAGCATVDPWTDTRIESEVKARLVAEHDANLTRLGVVSREQTVYLSGMVESGEQKDRAETVAPRRARRKARRQHPRSPHATRLTGFVARGRPSQFRGGLRSCILAVIRRCYSHGLQRETTKEPGQ